jgi:hypothetical protein
MLPMTLWLYGYLLAAMALFLTQVVLAYVKKVRVVLFSGVLLLMMVCLLIIQLITKTSLEQTFRITLQSAPPPLRDVLVTAPAAKPVSYTAQSATTQQAAYFSLLSIQPTSRDALINTALLYQAQNNDKQAYEYWMAAKQLDPNHPLFSQQLTTLTPPSAAL